jgi:prephenate dehydrogenase
MEGEPGFARERLARSQVAIIGLGLMGGSLAAALSSTHACREVVGVARRRGTLELAQQMRFIRRGTLDVREGVREADLVVLATPARDILAQLAVIGPWLKEGCVVMDLGSTKAAICQAMEGLPPTVQALGGHPMCGKERSGLSVAEPTLFRDKVFVLTPLARTTPQTVALGLALVQAVEARALLLDAERHDRLVAAISHLPALLAVTLVRAAEALAAEDALAWTLAASGFKDTSRLAAGDVTMLLDILATNRAPVLAALRQAQGELAGLIAALEEKDLSRLEETLEAARQRRMEVVR